MVLPGIDAPAETMVSAARQVQAAKRAWQDVSSVAFPSCPVLGKPQALGCHSPGVAAATGPAGQSLRSPEAVGRCAWQCSVSGPMPSASFGEAWRAPPHLHSRAPAGGFALGLGHPQATELRFPLASRQGSSRLSQQIWVGCFPGPGGGWCAGTEAAHSRSTQAEASGSQSPEPSCSPSSCRAGRTVRNTVHKLKGTRESKYRHLQSPRKRS